MTGLQQQQLAEHIRLRVENANLRTDLKAANETITCLRADNEWLAEALEQAMNDDEDWWMRARAALAAHKERTCQTQ